MTTELHIQQVAVTNSAWYLGNLVSVLISGAHTDGRFALIQSHEIKGCEPPRHVHHHEDEILYVLVGASWSGFMIAGNLDHLRYDLVHPENTHVFAWTLVMLGLTVVGIVAGIAATVQNYRHAPQERRTPPWVPLGLSMLVALLVGAILVAAIPRTGRAAQVSPAVLEQLPPVTLNAFNGGEIRVKAGQLAAFRLENPTAAGHSFDVDELSVHIPMPSESHSLALFSADKPGTYTFYCAPHYDKGSGQGMHGTLIVEP